MNKIEEHYKQQAEEHKGSKQATMKDITTREKEIEILLQQLKLIKNKVVNPRVLEIGCGNGYVSEQLSKQLELKMECIDFCEDFIEVAKQRNLSQVSFQVGNVLSLNHPNETFDSIFTERCLINLETWDNQKKALENIWKVLKNGGKYIMVESFTDGLKNLNDARNVVGLDSIKEPFHNIFFDKEKFINFIKGKFEIENHQTFMSSYFFGSRVLYPALARDKLVYNNKFVEFFKHLPSYGNYSHIQLFVLKKIENGNENTSF